MLLGNLIFEAIAQGVGEFFTYVIGKIIGRQFNMEAKKAQQTGEYAVIAIIVALVIVVTFKYS